MFFIKLSFENLLFILVHNEGFLNKTNLFRAEMSDSDDDFREEQHTRPRSRGSEAVSRTHSVPRGHCLLHERWRHSQVGQNIGRVMTVNYVGGMGAVDFQPSSNTYVMYLVSTTYIQSSLIWVIEVILHLFRLKLI